ncbi:MAG TPA: oligosaccharide flippase family protein [Beijerinckiaceae bacterium]|nr:oligosaccharide flippase family protein [Beijerinckiaceae bacterium]
MAERGKATGRLLGWLGWAGTDAIGRLLLMTGSTIVFSRLLAPREFGIAALVLTIVAAAALFVGSPFEEALAQRRHVRRQHFRAALGVSWLVAGVIVVLATLLGAPLAALYTEPEVGLLLPLAMTSVFFSGHSDILSALARRLRRFNDIAIATLAGHVVGIAAALAMAFAGFGLLALIGQRLFVVVARAIILQWRLGFLILPAWAPGHVRSFGRFAGYSFLSRLVENITYLAFTNLVQALYGIAVLGYVNMAMRLIEPIRGAIVATAHNVAFSFFARAAHDGEKLKRIASETASQAALAIAPIFTGLAAVSPVLLPLVAGPGWEDAIGIAVCLSLAAALAVPAGLIYTAFSATGRPEYSLYSLVVGFALISAILVAAKALGPISVGYSRVGGDLVRALFAILLSAATLPWTLGARLRTLAPAWLLSGIMGIAVAALGHALAGIAPVARLMIMISLGILIYAALLMVFARPFIIGLAARLRGGPHSGTSA